MSPRLPSSLNGARNVAPVLLAAAVILSLTSGCELRKKMYDQPKYETYEATDFFGDRRSARPLIEGTVARGHLRQDTHFYEGKVEGAPARTFPFEITRDVLERGRERYNIHCSVCHGKAGYGNGFVVQRGYKQPTSYHTERLREAEVGYLYDTITRGFGVMPSYAYQVTPRDRWAIVAYIRALQLSQNASIDDVPEDERSSLMAEIQ